jgi:hypothetical protein
VFRRVFASFVRAAALSTQRDRDALAQFESDLRVFFQRAAVSGKRVFAVRPIATCDAERQFTPAYGVENVLNHSPVASVGGSSGMVTREHLGADCRTPDEYLRNLWTQAVADDLTTKYKAALAEAK